MTKNVYGDGAVKYCKENNCKIIDRGNLEALHEIFDYAVKHGAKDFTHGPGGTHHPLKVHKRVLDALDGDERFEKGYINYPGIINRPCRAFTLLEQKNDL